MHQNSFMRTTIDLPDELFRQAKARAALSGLSLKELITRYVERGLRLGGEQTPAAPPRRGDVPEIIPPRGRTMPVLTHAEIQAILDAEDAVAVHGRTS